ncbi:hypothetical protein RN001_011875 [Aquatica leii]|uniref:Zinc finger BED domain-containing protein 5 n=1 Tax=Aquatica leii TaxID=1421715 RepID=A0AAN7P4T3_9COLE|nr:hypothetical protein RN001_011875 [Aquatica leii]
MDKFLKKPTTSSDASASGCGKTKFRKYDQSYIQFGFTELANKPQCVVCSEVLSAESESLYKVFVQATEPFEFDWKKCVSICSDGAMALTGKKSGLIARLKSFIPNASWAHCFLHRQALAAKKMPDECSKF